MLFVSFLLKKAFVVISGAQIIASFNAFSLPGGVIISLSIANCLNILPTVRDITDVVPTDVIFLPDCFSIF